MGGSLIQIVCWRKEPAVLSTCESGSCRSEEPGGTPGGGLALGGAAIVSLQNHVSAQISCTRTAAL